MAVVGVLGVVVGVGLASGGSDDGDDGGRSSTAATETHTETVTEEAPAPETAAAAVEEESGPAVTIQGGNYVVGTDMVAGTWRTDGPADSVIPNCYWARNSDASGELGAILANGNTEGPATVTVSDGEVFESSGCEPWSLVE
ncbi:hypothetical protein FHR81_001099 [Actinoalloteichus hoggarensis]|uniref:hypothetical protein n=1 Tax=Actinoalloteichus hoggarensis TaxID=1470176 RepID=UPI0012FDE2AC|nr:hypothetical protein [Actinoalloteichus hoggarensis]MBB5920069.1 hypothetical protein [Actinoalloteichus hoggarensis]